MRRVGVLMNHATDVPTAQARLATFVQGLHDTGWVDGHNIQIDTRWAAGDPEFASSRACVEIRAICPLGIRRRRWTICRAFTG